ncbi:tetratricopeptide (TPR) repeat protein [Aquimarina sp. EL_43]|uniref:tetratricopeptide repeat protein n=1 Tax=unclassified Aquimarina TaxID=2627091 RepID=UPI0018CB1FC1|nr:MULTISPECIES: tetratricopeptide repeat protein [unclassified Aquimarina]MBG6130355.1 tetratricopeptide (TPR) repeat protein [Aquimarina sp. EL_35]MBG6149135.1 tetratricopeptide (TPR) repeat protein [Aquimarina sp. EL_32]MBG6168491.1 tetratricopeptide (TPR) repeat protein [Aquimarina sp. EL_43]
MKIINIPIIYLLCFLSFSATVLSQNKKIDSLKKELKIYTKKDTVRVKILNHLAYYHYRNNPSQSLAYAEQAGKLADEIKSIKGKARSFYMKGITHMEQGNFKTSIANYEKAIELYTSIGDLKSIAGCNNALGVLNKYKGNQKLALEYYKKALAIDQKLGVKKNMPNYLYNIGSIYSDMGKHKEALGNFKKALQVYTNNKNEYGILSCFNSIAIVYLDQGNYPLAIEYNHKSLDIAKKSNDSLSIFQSLNNIGNIYRQQQLYDKALDFYKKALAIKQANRNSKSITAIKNNMGGIYIDKKEFAKAVSYFEETSKLSSAIQDNEHLATSLNGLGFAYLGMKRYSEALANFQEANKITSVNQQQYELVESYVGMAYVYYYMKKGNLALINAEKAAQLANTYKLLKHQRDAYELLSIINNELGEHQKALLSNQQLKILNDSLFNRENIQKITEVEYEYKYKNELESAEKRELRLTQTVKTTTNNLEKSQRNLLLGVIAFLTTTLLLGAIIFFLKLRNEKSKTQNIIIEQKLLRSQMTPHFIFNSLSVLQGMILNKEEKKSVAYLSKFSKLLRIILENSRDKTVSLSQELIAIENYLALQNLENKTYKYTVFVEATIDVSVFEIPPMLIQPFVENAIEHAFVNQKENRIIDVHLSYANKNLICTITDNGIGVDSQKENKKDNKKSLSTTITSERLKILSKDFKMKSSVTVEDRKKYNEQGTLVTLIIPYKIKEVQ